jgi:hypothetical protein
METDPNYTRLAEQYVAGARSILAPAAAPSGAERRGTGRAALIADQALALAPVSAQLTTAAAARLQAEDAEAPALAALSLLAKAATDLEISAALLWAAQEEETGRPATAAGAESRRSAARSDLDERLEIILGVERAAKPAARRAAARLDPAQARLELAQAAGDSLDLICKRAAQSGQAAINGLAGMGLAELGQAAGMVGMDLATALGQAEKVARLYELFRQFAWNAYESLLALLGPSLAKTAVSKAVEWVSETLQGERFEKLLEALYETRAIAEDLKQRAGSSQAEAEQVAPAKVALAALVERHKKQSDLATQLAKGLSWLGAVPAAALPHGQLLRGAAYLALAAYVILSGADYVDAPRLKLVDRLPGVRSVVEAALWPGPAVSPAPGSQAQ